ncbi:class II aldolase [Rhizobium rhizogenes]|uniref:class II aldolase/adducin family protein n=1 Tax=Rhizobium rhizogenes TaxID=359 RepID=UPI001571EEC6|nr:class II aldolase/adducin family protein [Rhizobium rhizogenes]NTI26461.1 class II aldolase [Rhizobium rhizogenes]NTI65843.1 class II aldolase [Rhizobium rhizogenes]QTG08752.1 class II aldolase [Rhizobium rhizogenes]
MQPSLHPTLAGDREFQRFLELSARLGQDIERTQGAGGNTSIKRDGILWVKASGTWLAHARERDIMVPVDTAALVTGLRSRDPRVEKATDFIVAHLNTNGLRPSIETSFHAVLPQPVVAHFHCVNTLALAVIERREELISRRMREGAPDLGFRFIPYRRPGTALAEEIDRVAAERPDVLFLLNHGIIIAGDTVDIVSERIETVTAALALPIAPVASKPDIGWLEAKARASGFRLPEDAAVHATALDTHAVAIAAGGSLYPDHVIFLGAQIGIVDDAQSVSDVLAGFRLKSLPAPKMLLVPGRGVLLADDVTAGGEVMARCLAEVTTRIPAGEALCYLSAAEEFELTHWEAEQYRQALDRSSGSPQ